MDQQCIKENIFLALKLYTLHGLCSKKEDTNQISFRNNDFYE